MNESVRSGLRIVDPANTPSDPLEVSGIVTCRSETLRGRAVLVYDFQETKRRRALPDEFHLRELMDLDVSRPEDVAEFCSSYGFPETDPMPSPWGGKYAYHVPLVRGSLDLLDPELIKACDEVQWDEVPWMTTELRFLEYTQLRLRDRLAQSPLILKEHHDCEILEGMRARGVRWAVAVDLACVATALAFLKDLVRLFLVRSEALCCDEMMVALEPRRHAFIRRLLVEDPESLIAEVVREGEWWPALLDAVKRARALGFYRDLEDPERGPMSSYTLSRLADFINEGLDRVPLRVAVHAVDFPELAHASTLSLRNATAIALYRDLTSPRLQYTRCANETCPHIFVKRRIASGVISEINSGWSIGVKYCSPECARMQAQREYRRRVSRARSLARQGVGLDEIARQVERDVATVSKWIG